MIFVRDIQRAVADYYGLSVGDLIAHDARPEFARPRQLAMCLATRLTERKLTEIGRLFDRDHSTVIHARDETERRAALLGPTRLALRAIERLFVAEEPSDEERLDDATGGSAMLRDAILALTAKSRLELLTERGR